ncbi:MAG TPA: signal peptidase I [Marmoricola sp.]|nr:signal peptidase I [Marmoricola sp.]
MATKAGKKQRRIPGWLEMVLLLGLALVLSVGIKTFFVQMFFVPSESMEPLFIKDDRILVEKVSYWNGDVERGDVIVFEDPGSWLGEQPELGPVQKALSTVGLYPTGGHLVKRVIGVGGDRVACCDRKGRITVNGVALDESEYLPEGVVPSAREFDVKVPEGHLWMMGDNRGNSEDSRFHQQLPGSGTVPVDRVVGKVWAIVWPVGRFERIERPETFEQKALDAG